MLGASSDSTIEHFPFNISNSTSRVLAGCGPDRSQYIRGFSVPVPNDFTRPNAPLDGAVRPKDAMFKGHIGVLRLQRLTHGERDSFTIVRVDEREQFLLRAVDQSRRHAEQRVNHWRPAEM